MTRIDQKTRVVSVDALATTGTALAARLDRWHSAMDDFQLIAYSRAEMSLDEFVRTLRELADALEGS